MAPETSFLAQRALPLTAAAGQATCWQLASPLSHGSPGKPTRPVARQQQQRFNPSADRSSATPAAAVQPRPLAAPVQQQQHTHQHKQQQKHTMQAFEVDRDGVHSTDLQLTPSATMPSDDASSCSSDQESDSWQPGNAGGTSSDSNEPSCRVEARTGTAAAARKLKAATAAARKPDVAAGVSSWRHPSTIASRCRPGKKATACLAASAGEMTANCDMMELTAAAGNAAACTHAPGAGHAAEQQVQVCRRL